MNGRGPDWILRQAARILAADPGMWGYLSDAMGGSLRVPFALTRNPRHDAFAPPPVYRAPAVVPGWVVIERGGVSINLPGFSGEHGMEPGDPSAQTVALENYEGKIRVYVYALDVGGPSHVVEVPPGGPRHYPPGYESIATE